MAEDRRSRARGGPRTTGAGGTGTRTPVRKRRARGGTGRGGLWVSLAVVLVLCGGGGYWAYRSGVFEGGRIANLPIPGLRAPETRELTLYFADPRWTRLAEEVRQVPVPGGDVDTMKVVVGALAQGPRDGLAPVLPEDARLRGAYIGSDGLAVLDFGDELKGFYPGGASGEALTVFAVVNSIAANVPGVERVQLLIGGKEAETLAGHVKISEPLAADAQWLQPVDR